MEDEADFIWEQFEKARSAATIDEASSSTATTEHPTSPHDEAANSLDGSKQLTCTKHYVNVNCGPTYFGGTQIAHRFLKAPPKMHRLHQLAEYASRNGTDRKAKCKIQLINEDLNRLEQIVRTRGNNLADIHINECRRVYKLIAGCMERLGMKRNKKKVEIASTYYALKQYFNPTPAEIETMFDAPHALFLAATKLTKKLAHNCLEELGWIFVVERGQTNLFRYANQFGLDRRTIQHLVTIARERNLNLHDESTVHSLLKRFRENASSGNPAPNQEPDGIPQDV